MRTWQNNTDRWRKCGINKLAEHFHRYNGENYQFIRLGKLWLPPADLSELFPTNAKIHSFDIEFALAELNTDEQFAFKPWISVRYNNNPTDIIRKEFQCNTPTPELAAPVPLEFKECVTKNWLKLDISLIDDVFSSFFSPNPIGISQEIVPLRLLGYRFNDSTNQLFYNFIKKVTGNIKGFTFYLGMDMNKFGQPEKFGFCPVIEVNTGTPTPEILMEVYQAGLRIVPTTAAEAVVYYEYMSPCPSSCSESENSTFI